MYKDILVTDPNIKYDDLLKKLSSGSGIGTGTIKKTLSEYKCTGAISSPINKKKRPTIVDKVDDFDKNAIRQKIHAFWFDEKFQRYQKSYEQ